MRIDVYISRLSLILMFHSFLIFSKVSGQEINGFLYPEVKENIFYETQWQYIYTLHVESQTIIHKASENFSAYYYFRLDHQAQSYVNDAASNGIWKINNHWLIAPVLNLDSLLIVKVDDQQLILETRNKTGKGNLQYFLSKHENKLEIFKKPDYLLPEVNVTSTSKQKTPKQKEFWINNIWDWLLGNQADVPYKAPLTFIAIEMTGGGYYGGIDPPIRNYIQLKSDGRLIREFSTEYNGMTKTVKNIGRTEVEAFVEYIDSKAFFELKSSYDCIEPYCKSRLSKKPIPIPLRVAVTYGMKHKVVSIPIFGLDETNHKYLDYPPIIDNIVETLNRMANRLD